MSFCNVFLILCVFIVPVCQEYHIVRSVVQYKFYTFLRQQYHFFVILQTLDFSVRSSFLLTFVGLFLDENCDRHDGTGRNLIFK